MEPVVRFNRTSEEIILRTKDGQEIALTLREARWMGLEINRALNTISKFYALTGKGWDISS